MNLGRNLKFYRKKYGITQESLAEKLGYKNPSTIQKWETGVSEPPIHVLVELCNYYNVSIDKLVYDDYVDIPKNDKLSETLVIGNAHESVKRREKMKASYNPNKIFIEQLIDLKNSPMPHKSLKAAFEQIKLDDLQLESNIEIMFGQESAMDENTYQHNGSDYHIPGAITWVDDNNSYLLDFILYYCKTDKDYIIILDVDWEIG
jgi:transcriptional regulator with XRE-family HTH domain